MRYLKLFESFNQEEYDPLSYDGCGCCPVCTGEKDCECGCPECNCPVDDEDDDFGFESPFCTSCEGTGCEECEGSGMKRNSITN
jgi:hypothetical protein